MQRGGLEDLLGLTIVKFVVCRGISRRCDFFFSFGAGEIFRGMKCGSAG